MDNYLSLTDLFLVGLALDISGAALLAKGLLISVPMIAEVSATKWDGNQEVSADRCRNRVDAEYGITFLLAGFVLQAFGYLLALAGVHTETGGRRVVVAGVLGLAGAGVAWFAWWRTHESRVEQLEIAVADLANEVD
ncbi:MAG: hypothetical protein JST59_26430 [Actinobacteria bacterium]|nr:hypothetical protein [Actinomycetota bacterium]